MKKSRLLFTSLVTVTERLDRVGLLLSAAGRTGCMTEVGGCNGMTRADGMDEDGGEEESPSFHFS